MWTAPLLKTEVFSDCTEGAVDPYFFIVSIMSNTYTARNANILIGVHVSPGLLEEMMEHYDEIMMRSHLNILCIGLRLEPSPFEHMMA